MDTIRKVLFSHSDGLGCLWDGSVRNRSGALLDQKLDHGFVTQGLGGIQHRATVRVGGIDIDTRFRRQLDCFEHQGFALEGMPDVAFDGERVSSSAVRAALQAGDFARAERLLGRPYAISGKVIHGTRLGHDLGFPTANIALRQRPPLSGIYVVEVEGFGPAVASVGLRPTVNPVASPLLEVHLLERGGELYGRRLRVTFLRKLRDEAKFDGLAALRDAIARDAEEARQYFARHG